MADKWYVATLLIRSRIDDGETDIPWLCDEQIRLILAADDNTAYEKAVQLGKEEEHSYENANGDRAHWEFLGLEALHILDASLEDGVEINSRLIEHHEPEALIRPKEQLIMDAEVPLAEFYSTMT